MPGLWIRFFSSLTRGADLSVIIIKSSVLSLLSCLFTLPYFYYLIFEFPRKRLYSGQFSPWVLLFTQLFLLLFICFLSAFIGFAFEKRYQLKGFGSLKTFISDMPGIFSIGALLMALSYILFDRFFLIISPDSYPSDLFYIAILPFRAAFTEEVILRLCLVTLGIGLFRSRITSVCIVSCLASIYSFKYFYFIGISVEINLLFISYLIISFAANLVLGYLFIKRGLLSSMFLKFIFNMRYLFIFLLAI